MDGQVGTLTTLRERLAEGRFHLAVLGQFKRGKSTLLNALLGEEILPSSVIPLTAIPTFVRGGKQREVAIHYQDGRPEDIIVAGSAMEMNNILLRYVSEEYNPKNTLAITYVEIQHPATILRDVVLIDTPGIGSTHRHNTEMTLNFLPQCDAALFLVSADPPLTEVEVGFLREIRQKVARLFFVLNKVDYLDQDELETALAFLRRVLHENIGLEERGHIFPVSSRMGLRAREKDDTELWEKSGLSAVNDHLVTFLAREKFLVLREAVAQKALDVLNEAALQVQLKIRSLELPLDTLKDRLTFFDQKISEARQQQKYARDILKGDHIRGAELLEQESARLREAARAHLTRIAELAMISGIEQGSQTISDAIAAEIPVYFEHALGEFSARFDREITILLQGHQKRADDLIESVRLAASDLFEIPYHAPESERVFVMARKPYWVSRKDWSSFINPLSPEVIERAMPRAMREKRIRARLAKEIETLVIRNVENLRWATLQNIDAAFRVFSRDLDENIEKTIDATHGAIKATYERRKVHEEESASALQQLNIAFRNLTGVIQRFSAKQG